MNLSGKLYMIFSYSNKFTSFKSNVIKTTNYYFYRSYFSCQSSYFKPSITVLFNKFSCQNCLTNRRSSNYGAKKSYMGKVQHRQQLADSPIKAVSYDNLLDNEFDQAFGENGVNLNGISNVAVLQPWIKWGGTKRIDTTANMMLEEACSLVSSLPYTKVSHKEYITLLSVEKTLVFGSGTIERLKETFILSNSQAVFISIDYLKMGQKKELEAQFGLPVYDRFYIVLSIFKAHANTLEARLQIAIAEIPFLTRSIKINADKLLLDKRKFRLQSALRSDEVRRQSIREVRKRNEIPSIAVLGYTNCGKTTFIRALTGDERCVGKDRLFATLEATSHGAHLPCGSHVLFMDSVGFIQNIPTTLVASFRATIQEAVAADLLVVVHDISHPDLQSQMGSVSKTLKSLKMRIDMPIINVFNKVDKLTEKENNPLVKELEGFFVSSITGEGLMKVVHEVEKIIVEKTGRQIIDLKLPTGSRKIDWFREHVGVCDEKVDDTNQQLTCLRVVMNEGQKAAFRRAFKQQKAN